MQNQLRVVDNSDMIRHQAWLIKPNYFPIEQNTVFSKMVVSGKKRARDQGHLTGRNSDPGHIRISYRATIISALSSDLAKLNRKCHMKYSNYLVTEET